MNRQVIYDFVNRVSLRSQFSHWTEIIRISSCFHSVQHVRFLIVLTANFLLSVLFITIEDELRRAADEQLVLEYPSDELTCMWRWLSDLELLALS